MKNVFISHRMNDALEAEKLANEIKSAGHNVWIDVWEIGLGDSIVGKMDEGLFNADYLVLCYSSDGIHSPYMSREWYSTLSRQLNGVSIKILPVRLTGGDPPAILADLVYADLVKDWFKGIKYLLSSIK